MFVQGDWLNVGIVTALAFGLFLCMLAAELVEIALNGLLDLLGTFVFRTPQN